MTTITIDRTLLVRMEKELFLARNYGGILRDEPLLNEVSAALSAPATAPEKTVKEIMEFARHYAADTFSSATLEDKIRRSLAAPATALNDRLRNESKRKPMTDQDTLDLFNRIQLRMRFTDADARPFASGVASAEFFHGIKDKP